MVGFVNAKVQLAEARAENEKLKAQNVALKRQLREAGVDGAKAKRIVSRTYDDSIIDELITWSEEGLFLDECLANWGIDQDTWGKWLEEHVTLREAVGPSRARARAAMLRILREGLKTRNAFPTSLADRIIAMVESENGAREEQADGLLRIDLCPRCASADAASSPVVAEVIERKA